MKKADLVRKMIAEAKAQNITADELITAVMQEVGFARQLARAYVKNNWEKVTAAEAQQQQEE